MDVNEFKEKALPLKNKLFRIALRLLNNFEEAEDAIQEVYIRLWNNRDKLTSASHLEAMAVTITRNYCIDLNRKKKILLFEINDEVINVNIDSPEKEFLQNEIYHIIHKAINELPENQKLALQLKDIEGLSLNEIANIMHVSNGNVRVLLSRARTHLKSLLKTKYRAEL